jgi:hypothetical protein
LDRWCRVHGVSLLLLLHRLQVVPGRWALWLLPLLLIGYGLESLADLWLHGDAAPANYGQENQQHLLQGGVLLVAGVVEALLLKSMLQAAVWRLVLPLALAVVAIVFLLHAQHGAGGSMALMQVQHRAFAIALLVAAAARMLENHPAFDRSGLRGAWLLALLIFGLELLTYAEASRPHEAA